MEVMMSGPDQPVLYAVEEHVAWITLNRPERANAISDATVSGLLEAFDRATDDRDVRAVAITADGDRFFCAGRDLKELNEKRAQGVKVTAQMGGTQRNTYEALFELPKPTVAVINGAAYGGGLELTLACDLRIASRSAKLAAPEAKRGMGANFASVMLPNLIARHHALEILYTGDPVTAERALEIGLINAVAEPDALRSDARAMLDRIVVNAPLSLRRFKETAVKSIGLPISAALRLNVYPNPYESEDREEGVRAYVEGRPPRWQAR
jgi:enoyl-CoA hydratase